MANDVATTRPFHLSRREAEIAALISHGETNAAIARTLGLGTRTVETVVARLLRKLDVASRTQIAVWFVIQGRSEKDASCRN